MCSCVCELFKILLFCSWNSSIVRTPSSNNWLSMRKSSKYFLLRFAWLSGDKLCKDCDELLAGDDDGSVDVPVSTFSIAVAAPARASDYLSFLLTSRKRNSRRVIIVIVPTHSNKFCPKCVLWTSIFVTVLLFKQCTDFFFHFTMTISFSRWLNSLISSFLFLGVALTFPITPELNLIWDHHKNTLL